MFSCHSPLPCIDIITSFTRRVKTKCVCADRRHLGQDVRRPQCYYSYYRPYIEIVVFFFPPHSASCQRCGRVWRHTHLQMFSFVPFFHNNTLLFTSCNFYIFFFLHFFFWFWTKQMTSWSGSEQEHTKEWQVEHESKKKSRNINSCTESTRLFSCITK